MKKLSLFFRNLKHIGRYLIDGEVSMFEKMYILFIFFYILFPFDVLPDFLFPAGFLDDGLLLVVTLFYINVRLNKYLTKKENSNNINKEFMASDKVIEIDFEEIKERIEDKDE